MIKDCLEKGWTGMGYRTEEFEAEWSKYTGSPHSHFLNSSTSGLNLAVEILGRKNMWSSASEILTTPLTFISTNHAILHAGYIPVFADCDDSGCLTVETIEQSITSKTVCVMFVGLGGNFGELPEIAKLCSDKGISLVVDAAHMAGSRSDSYHPCHYGDVTIYSFQAVKNLPTADSGALCTKDPEIDMLARRLSWLGIDKDTYQRSREGRYKWDYNVSELGYKYHGNSVMASMALAQLPTLDSDNCHRRKVASWYKELIRNDAIKVVSHANEASSSRHLFQIETPEDSREDLMNYLSTMGISTGVHYKDNTLYSMYSGCTSHATSARSLWERLVTLPCHVSLTMNDVERISSALNSYRVS